MRKLMKGCLGVAAALLAAHLALTEVNAGVFSECSPCKEAACDPCDAVCGETSTWEWGGWMEASLYSNQYGQRNVYDPALGEHNLAVPGNTNLLNNARQSDFQMNQLGLYFGKKLDTRRGFDYGGRVEAMYGTDARYTQSQGLEYTTGNNRRWGDGDYYAAMNQLYGEVGYKSVSVKVGKFHTPMGQEGIVSTARFFYSLSYQFAALPVTHTGALATWAPQSNLSVFAGWVNGQGMGQEDYTFYDTDNNAALFGAKYTWNKKVSLWYSALIGRQTNVFNIPFDHDYFVQSFIVKVKPNHRWDYTFEWTLRNDVGTVGDQAAYWGAYGINNELVYHVNAKWAVGLRAEWMHGYSADHNGMSVGGLGGFGGNAYELTAGLNWTPTKWLLIRPEMRYDKVFGGASPFNTVGYDGDTVVLRDDPRNEQFSGGVSAVVKF